MELTKTMEDCSKYLFEEQRVRTFKSWVFGSETPCNTEKMAEAGFIFIGNKREPDAVKCFFCQKTLDGWESTDNPWQEHLKHAPYCKFAKLQKSQEKLTLKELVELRHDYMIKLIDTFLEDQNSDLTSMVKKMETQLKK